MSDPLTPADVLTTLRNHLASYITAKKGRLSLATDPFNTLELLTASPGGFLVILAWAGDSDAPDGGDEEGVVFNHLEVIVSTHRGLPAKPGDDLVTGRASQQPLLVLVSQVRAKVRALVWADSITYGVLLYKGAEVMLHPTDQLPLRAFKLRFDLMASISTDGGA